MSEPRELRALIGRFRRRWTCCAVARAIGLAAAAASLPLLTFACAARLVGLSGLPLVAGAAAALSAAALAAVVVLARRWRRPDDRQVARYIEERVEAVGAAGFDDGLATAVQVLDGPSPHEGFGPEVVRRAVAVLQSLDPADLIPRAAVRRSFLQAVAGVVMLAGAVAAALPHAQRAAATAWFTWIPGAVTIQVITGDVRVAAGQPARIRARLLGRGLARLQAPPALVVTAEGQQRSVPMAGASGEFEYLIESIDRSFEYRVAAGASASETYSVTALFAPRVERIDLHYTYPSFTRLPPRQEQDGGDIYAPAGTRVRLVVHSDKPLAAGELALGDGASVPLSANGPSASAELVVAADNRYRVHLRDGDGLASAGTVEHFIRVMDDRPPIVRILRPGADLGISPLEEIVIEARAEDDHGLASFDLVYTVAGRAPHRVPLAPGIGTDRERTARYVLPAEELGVRPGDVITVFASARDVARGRPSTESRSDIFFLEVRPFNEEFVSAESQGGGRGGGTQLDGLVAAQKDIITATWNLERRSGAGRSAEDLRAVERAQAALKARLEQMLGGAGRGGRGPMPMQQVRPAPRSGRAAGPDPATAALLAMSRALEQLGQQQTAAAIPYEMEALQALLQAQAEIRRRQVMMQQAMSGGGGGTSRSDRDLSALFDRELQRQQRTTYETPPQAAGAEEPGAGDVMDRVRDLARRQDELARRQTTLADAAEHPDERKRQLERLMREQEELRQRLERLERDMQPPNPSAHAAGGGGSDQPRSQSGADAAGRAAEAARRAVEEMGRGNTAGASARSRQAADALRQLEGQIRSRSEEARRRAAGDLELEAQQLADAQRRIAADAARLDTDRRQTGRRDGDAQRRMATEKDALADRVDALERAAAQLAREVPAAAGAPLAEAARRLRDQEIAERMRASARRLRAQPGADAGGDARGTPDGSHALAPDEHRLAQALASVVDAFGGSALAGAREAADALERVRQIRERLDRAEAQLRQAEGQGPARPADTTASPGRDREAEAGAQLDRARDEYARELRRAQAEIRRLQREHRGARGGATPEHHEYSRSAPGDEPWKQDVSSWDVLRRDVDAAIERYEAALGAGLVRPRSDERLNGGGSEHVPEPYRSMVARYFESLAGVKR